MNLTFRALQPQDDDLLIHYFQSLDYSHNPEWKTCYCSFYHSDCSMEDWISRSERGENEQLTRRSIRQGSMKGYLALVDDHVVGWLNVNHYHAYLRLLRDIQPWIRSPQTAVAICFVIHPQYRGQGIARRLLGYAIKDLKDQGFEALMSLPRESPNQPTVRYRGTFHMFDELGFTLVNDQGETRIYYKTLKNDGAQD